LRPVSGGMGESQSDRAVPGGVQHMQRPRNTWGTAYWGEQRRGRRGWDIELGRKGLGWGHEVAVSLSRIP
jgi:hypothetical protein